MKRWLKLTLINESQIENPEKGTAGLASTTQLVDSTGSTLTITFNTSSASLNHIRFLRFQRRRKVSKGRKKKHKTRREIFRTNLRKAMRMNSEILRDLARY